MINEALRAEVARVHDELVQLRDLFDVDSKEKELEEIQKTMEDPAFWKDQEAAQKIVGQLKILRTTIEPVKELEAALEDQQVMLQLAEEEGDAQTMAEVQAVVAAIAGKLEHLQFRTMLSGRYDARNAYLSIHAGAGGTEACDWVQMLMRMYSRWAEEKGFDMTMIESVPGDEAGLRSVTLFVVGPYAYGYLRAEIGVHRLVRISPFDAAARRHTSFASVDAVPEIDEETAEIEIPEKDLRIDTYRAGGPGGQHVNVTDSAVRITHVPTGVVAACQNERSQIQNRHTAMKMLQAKLFRLREREREQHLAQLTGEKGEIAFGSQIRSYVLQPYQMIKDHRTGLEVGDVNAVLNGEIDEFIEAFLRARKQQKKEQPLQKSAKKLET
ncbi:MAG TPA: peptide chain release factor 2 [Planctomycetota bacterium]|nr:peptide chain release factor 2 [Planctomycetota bacterium]